MQSIFKYNQLSESTRSRKEIESLIKLAEDEEQEHIAKKLKTILDNYPDAESFDFDIGNLASEQVPHSYLAGVEYAPNEEGEVQAMGKPVPPSEIYQMITNKVIEMMKDATGKNYVKKWASKNKFSGFTIPFNFETGKPYRGINYFLLKSRIGIFSAFKNPYFLTFKQIEKNKGKLKKDSKGYPVVYFSVLYKMNEIGGKCKDFATYDKNKMRAFIQKNNLTKKEVAIFLEEIPFLKYYNVFNGEDIEGIDFKLDAIEIGRIMPEDSPENKAASLIVKNYPNAPKIYHGGDSAFYSPIMDKVQMPIFDDFETANDYYRTLFHELTHSTGHSKRLKRDLKKPFGSKEYAFEELIAEFGAVFLSSQAGIIWYANKNHAEYLKNWSSVLKIAEDDNRFLMRAASAAQKASDYILDLDTNGEPKFWKELSEINNVEEPIKRKSKSKKKKKDLVSNNKGKKNNSPQLDLFSGMNAPNKLEISTEKFKNMSVTELRKFTLEYYNTHLKGNKAIIKKHLKEVVFTNRAGKKIARGEAMYSAKASAVERLKELIENSTYNNWGNRKQKDAKDVLGYLNFKSKITIDEQKRHVRIALAVYKDRKTQLKNIEVGNKKPPKPTQEPVATLPNDEIREVSQGKTTKKTINSKND